MKKTSPTTSSLTVLIDDFKSTLRHVNSLPIGVMKLNPSLPSHDTFVDCCKMIIDKRADRANGYDLEFSNDFTAIRKRTKYVPA